MDSPGLQRGTLEAMSQRATGTGCQCVFTNRGRRIETLLAGENYEMNARPVVREILIARKLKRWSIIARAHRAIYPTRLRKENLLALVQKVRGDRGADRTA